MLPRASPAWEAYGLPGFIAPTDGYTEAGDSYSDGYVAFHNREESTVPAAPTGWNISIFCLNKRKSVFAWRKPVSAVISVFSLLCVCIFCGCQINSSADYFRTRIFL